MKRRRRKSLSLKNHQTNFTSINKMDDKCKKCGKDVPKNDDIVMYLSSTGWEEEVYCEGCLKKVKLVK